jgi:hypothetical protein
MFFQWLEVPLSLLTLMKSGKAVFDSCESRYACKSVAD